MVLPGTLGELAYNGNTQVKVFIHRVATTFCPSIIIDFGNERVVKDTINMILKLIYVCLE